jgi:hypothetical protein
MAWNDEVVRPQATTSVSDRGSIGETTVTSFTSTSSAVIEPFNSSRKMTTIYHETGGDLYVLYGPGTASSTNYSVKMSPGDYLEVVSYTGQITGVFSSSGTARVSEIS